MLFFVHFVKRRFVCVCVGGGCGGVCVCGVCVCVCVKFQGISEHISIEWHHVYTLLCWGKALFTYIHTYIQEAFLTRHFQRSQRGDTKKCINKNKIQMKNTREIHNQKLHLWKQMRFESLFENRHWFSTAHRRRQLVPNVGSGVSKCLVSSRFESPTADDWHSQSCGIRGRS